MAITDRTTADQTGNEGVRNEKVADSGGFGSFHTGSLFAAPISRGIGSDVYSKLKTSLAEYYKEANSNVKIALIDLDNENNVTFKYSSLIVALQLKGSPELGVAYHILTMAATGDELTPVYDTLNNQQIEIQRVPSDAVDSVLISAADHLVRQAFPGATTYFVDATILPVGFNPEDRAAVHKIALNSGMACATELQTLQESFRDLNLAHIKKESSLTISLNFGRTQHEDAVGEPVRSDVRIAFVSKKNGQNARNVSINSGDREVSVSKVSGFVDLVWSPAEGFSGYNPLMAQNLPAQMMMNPAMTRKYAARLVLTDLQSEYAYTPATVLLAVATAMTAADNNNWYQVYRPTPSNGKVIDLNDVGALNIEANLNNEPSGFGTRINTKAEDFRLSELGVLLSTLVKPGMMLAIDCPESGPQSWYLSVFAAAANGSAAAYDQIYNAANSLTDGAFGRHFASGSQMFTDVGNRIHRGSWTDRQGNKRDLRDFDHLAVCNQLGENNPQAIRDFSDTFLRTEFPLRQRLAARKRMIMSMSGETAVFTGFSQRVTFSGPALLALSLAVKETGLPVTVTTPLSAADFNNARGVGNFADQALLAPGMTFQQNVPFGGMNQFNNQGFNGGRW